MSPRFIFLHLPKTAGTTFISILRNLYDKESIAHIIQPWNFTMDEQFTNPRLKPYHHESTLAPVDWDSVAKAKLILGHFEFGLSEYLQPRPEDHYITFLRDPFLRLVSEYRHAVREPKHWNHHATKQGKVGLVEFAQSGASVTLDNLYTRFLSGRMQSIPFGECQESDYEKALANLQSFNFIGLTEQFDESLVLLARKLRRRTDEMGYVPRRVSNENHAANYTQERVQLWSRTRWDEKLFEAAKQRLQTELSSLENLADEVASLQESKLAVAARARRPISILRKAKRKFF